MNTEKGFHRHGSNSYIAEFAESEREVLLNLIEQLIALLSERVDHGHGLRALRVIRSAVQ